MKKETNIVKDNLFEIKKKLDSIIEVLKKHDINFNYHVITNLNRVMDFNENKEYKCPNKTIILKDEEDREKGIGVIYNITDKNILIVGTLGVGYLNMKKNKRMTNSYYFIDLNEKESFDDIYVHILKILLSEYILKYNLTESFDINIVPELVNAVCN